MSSILPKNELENHNFCPSLLGQKFFVRLLVELKKNQKVISKLTDLYILTIINIKCLVTAHSNPGFFRKTFSAFNLWILTVRTLFKLSMDSLRSYFITNAPPFSWPFPVIKIEWVTYCTHLILMAGNGQLTRSAFVMKKQL